MASRRMFSTKIVESDAFLEMPLSTQTLYFHLGMNCDDDGFVGNPKTLMRMVGCKEDDLKILLAKHFIYLFENGVIVIKHHKENNYIRGDRYHITNYKNEKNLLSFDENGNYTLKNGLTEPLDTNVIPMVANLDTEDKLSKDKIREDKLREKETNKEKETEPMALSTSVDVVSEEEMMFNEFWKLYPKKRAKQQCLTAYRRIPKLKTTHKLIIDALNILILSEQWRKANGQYIPNPLTFIHQRRWEDINVESNTNEVLEDWINDR